MQSPPLVSHPGWITVQITMYRRSYPVADAPEALSLVPFAASQKHTFTAGTRVYEAEYTELKVVVPDDAKLDLMKNLLCWAGDQGAMKSTAKEVYDLAAAKTGKFRLGK